VPIDHIIVLMLENRSFDHLLAYSEISGLAGVDTSKTNPGASAPVAMSNTAPDRMTLDLGHEFEDVDWQIYAAPRGSAPRPITLTGFANRGWPQAMQCATSGRVPVLTHLASEFLVCDNWFASMPGPTWPNRFFVHAGSSGGLANSPSSLTTIGSVLWPKVGFSFQHGTLYDALTRAGRTWRIYHGDHFPQVCAIDTMPSVFVASKDQFRPQNAFATDAAAGDLPSYTFIEPNYSILSTFRNGDCQHPAGTLSAGEQLINSVANAVIGSPLWKSSMLIILYDEHGGFYDQVPPPAGCTPPGDSALNADKASKPPNPSFGFDRYGIRVPAVVVSPWVTPRTVSHSLYDHTSVIRTVFDVFGIQGQLTSRDGNATSLSPLIQQSLQTVAPQALPSANSPEELASEAPVPNPPYSHSVDGFTRIAAQVHHALLNYQAGMQPHELHAAVAASPNLGALPLLPKTDSQDEARAYIAHVASLVQAHRLRQGP
jgi:phospholipase C